MYSTAVVIPGVPFSLQIYATNSPTSFSVDDLPAGLTVNTVTGLISGTPVSEIMNMTVKATNSGGTGSKVISNTVLDGLPPTPPTELVATEITATEFWFSWKTSTGDIDLASTEIYKNGTLNKSLGPSQAHGLATADRIQLQTPGSTNTWKVRTKDLQGLFSDFSEEISVTHLQS